MRGTFKGFAMLRQIALSSSQPGMPGFGQPQPVYVQGYGFVPPSQVRGWGGCHLAGRGSGRMPGVSQLGSSARRLRCVCRVASPARLSGPAWPA